MPSFITPQTLFALNKFSGPIGSVPSNSISATLLDTSQNQPNRLNSFLTITDPNQIQSLRAETLLQFPSSSTSSTTTTITTTITTTSLTTSITTSFTTSFTTTSSTTTSSTTSPATSPTSSSISGTYKPTITATLYGVQPMSKSSGHHRATIPSPTSGSNGVLPLLFAGSGTAFALLLLLAAYHLLRRIVSTCRRRRRHRGPASQSAGIKRDLRQNTYGRLASRVGHPASDDDGESITQDKDVRRASAIANSGSEDGGPAAPPLALQIYVNRLEERVQHLERVLEARGATSAMNPISLVVAARARAPSTSQGAFEMDTDMETSTGTGTTGGDSQQFDAAATTTIARAHANPFLQDEEESRFRRDGLPPSPEPERTNDSPLSYTTNTQRGSQAESVNSVGGRSSPPEYRSREVSLRSNAN